jgi:ELWxxDGT repeat protein
MRKVYKPTKHQPSVMKKFFIRGILSGLCNLVRNSEFRFVCILFAFMMLKAPVYSQPYTLLKDIYPGTGGTQNFFPTNLNGILYFQANDGIHGNELWRSDGTAAGTYMVKDIWPGAGASMRTQIYNLNGTLCFSAQDGVHGEELWKSDGSAAGTVMVKDMNPGSQSGFAGECVELNGVLYFQGTDPVHGNELWRSDGTEAGTYMLVDINPGVYVSGLGAGYPHSSGPREFCEINGTIFFSAYDEEHKAELWKTDGTIAGTVLVKDCLPDIFGSNPTYLFNLNGTLAFIADWYGNDQLWRSDGTEAGTYALADIPSSESLQYSTVINGVLYFSRGLALWKSDGTSAGTSVLRSGQNYMITNVNGTIYFFVVNASNSLELWKTNGTPAGTVMVKAMDPIPQPNYPFTTGKAGNNFLFMFDDGIHGLELWTSDGTAAGTHLLQDFEPGAGGITCSGISESNEKAFLAITTSANGNELWVAHVGANIPLPLTLLEFKGSVQNDNGILQWKTDNELNTKSFAVERSTDGRHFSGIGNVNAANENGVHDYNYTDASIKSLSSSIIYYRLRQVDADSKSTYSRIVALTLDKQKSFAMLYPNPVGKDINLTITLAKKDKLSWQLMDNYGRQIKNGNYDLSAGSTALTIDGSQLSSGNYFLRLNGELLQETMKIVKQ